VRQSKENGHLKIEYRPIAHLIPYPKNARTHTDSQITQVIANIKKFGWTNPILLDGKNGVIAGHARLEAAKRLGSMYPVLSWLACPRLRNVPTSSPTTSWR
jgi:ParB-like chromosome segregation protein Spo0J